MPAPSAAPTTAPIDVAMMWLGTRFSCSNARKAPACARAFAPPPDNTRTTLFTAPLIVSAFHHAVRAALRRPVVTPLLVGRLGHNPRHVPGAAGVGGGDVGHVARVRMPPVARQHVL